MGLKRVCLIFVLGIWLMPSPAAWAQTKIAYFDPNEILTKYKPFQEAQKEYDTYSNELHRELVKLQNEHKKMKDAYERRKLVLMEQRKKEEEQELGRKEEALNRYAAEVTDPERGKLALKQQELLAPLLARVNETVSKVAKENGYDFVINAAYLVYYNEDYDLTEKVMEELNKELETGETQPGGPGR